VKKWISLQCSSRHQGYVFSRASILLSDSSQHII
jgi:hypothetical protein